MSSDNGDFATYDAHYRRMGNRSGVDQIAPIDARDHRKPWMQGLSLAAKILDCGCGYGLQLQALHHMDYTDLYGIELVKEMAQAASQSLEGIAVIEHADARDWLPLRPESFDVIILNDVLEHIPRHDTVAFLSLLRQALKPNGILHLRVPDMATLLSGYSCISTSHTFADIRNFH